MGYILGDMKLSSKLIKEARTAAGLTQVELARRAGTSQPTVAAYESGEKVPTVGTLERLLHAAGVDLVAAPTSPGPHATDLRRLLRDKRERILEVAAKHGARNLRIFGSVARGEEDERSDIDLLVEMEEGSSLLDQVRLRRGLAKVLGVEVDVVTSGGLRDRDRETILRQAVSI